ncbi:MAG: hypothetical protein J5J06_05535 [Phycisphaerae bacterium]|nr:hypothetical protein [Phycisphaerae bacterium]
MKEGTEPRSHEATEQGCTACEASARDDAAARLTCLYGVITKALCAVPKPGSTPETITGRFDVEYVHVVRAVLAEALRDIPQLTYEIGQHRTDPVGHCVVTFRWEEATKLRSHGATKGEACSQK